MNLANIFKCQSQEWCKEYDQHEVVMCILSQQHCLLASHESFRPANKLWFCGECDRVIFAPINGASKIMILCYFEHSIGSYQLVCMQTFRHVKIISWTITHISQCSCEHLKNEYNHFSAYTGIYTGLFSQPKNVHINIYLINSWSIQLMKRIH